MSRFMNSDLNPHVGMFPEVQKFVTIQLRSLWTKVSQSPLTRHFGSCFNSYSRIVTKIH